jgi:pyrimidine-nucleoside phosphorylase
MTPYEIIRKKRDGETLSKAEICYLIEEFIRGNIKEYQISAFLMTVFYKGLNEEETLYLTDAYLHSGKTIDLSDIPGAKIDKHSTGGVGDKVSIILAPLAACLGIRVPMISGRGLGHTGGTLDKLESIPGFQVTGSIKRFQNQVKEIGVAMFGQSESIVPADRRIYALRDVTATVDSIPLITASIMSKKLAAGIDGLVLDVKVGNGSFIPKISQAEKLARSLINVGKAFRKKVTVYLTSMDQPLGFKIGNWLEIEECLDCLKGRGPQDLQKITIELTSEMLLQGGITREIKEARKKCLEALNNGKAFDKFLEIVHQQGGNIQFLLQPEKFSRARYGKEIKAMRDGIVASINTYQVGIGGIYLGAGRLNAEAKIDPDAGIILHKKIGDSVQKGEVLLEIHSNKRPSIGAAVKYLKDAIKIEQKEIKPPKLILKRLS